MKNVKLIITEFGLSSTTNIIVEQDYFERQLRNVELGNIMFMRLPNWKNPTKYINPKFVSNIEIIDVKE